MSDSKKQVLPEILFEIKKIKETAAFGQFVISPLENGYGSTLGNALRRVLLTSISGAAVTKIRVAGVKHKFSTLEGLREDIIDLVLNVKEIKISCKSTKPIKLTLEKTGPGKVLASDIDLPTGVKISNPDLVIGELSTKKDRLKMNLVVESGFGYSSADERVSDKIGEIPVDALFTPVVQVDYKIEATRVGRRTDFDKLLLNITTDGTISPSEVLKQGAALLSSYFGQIVNPKKVVKKKNAEKEVANPDLKLTIEELDLPTRVANALRKSGYETVEDLTKVTADDLSKVKNLGGKSAKIVEKALSEKNLTIKK
ncbi:MAG: DNA-directed RNA polymerase subunit alpha [Patescibacteria group bacterium]|nr:DNA-directed RNA polymerase subunit alpha [Patescibacteria group bacterium]